MEKGREGGSGGLLGSERKIDLLPSPPLSLAFTIQNARFWERAHINLPPSFSFPSKKNPFHGIPLPPLSNLVFFP